MGAPETLAVALALAASLVVMCSAELCNVGHEECGILKDRECPDTESGHPSYLTRCCGMNQNGCYTACCVPADDLQQSFLVSMTLLILFLIAIPILSFVCRKCCMKRYRPLVNAEPDSVNAIPLVAVGPSARATRDVAASPPPYYGEDAKAPDYSQVFEHERVDPTIAPVGEGALASDHPYDPTDAQSSEEEGDSSVDPATVPLVSNETSTNGAFPPPYESSA